MIDSNLINFEMNRLLSFPIPLCIVLYCETVIHDLEYLCFIRVYFHVHLKWSNVWWLWIGIWRRLGQKPLHQKMPPDPLFKNYLLLQSVWLHHLCCLMMIRTFYLQHEIPLSLWKYHANSIAVMSRSLLWQRVASFPFLQDILCSLSNFSLQGHCVGRFDIVKLYFKSTVSRSFPECSGIHPLDVYST